MTHYQIKINFYKKNRTLCYKTLSYIFAQTFVYVHLSRIKERINVVFTLYNPI